MKRHFCRCGARVFFDNQHCVACGRWLAFQPDGLSMQAVAPEPSAALCANRASVIRCNWFAEPGHNWCLSCLTSKLIPSLDNPENHRRWRKLEIAKRRLIYGLLSLGLPVDPERLSFEFKEDQRTNPDVFEQHVATGHRQGVITVNVAEADDVYREQMREAMNEPWRTLLSHLRHESGHYYFSLLVSDERIDEARQLFGDERTDYAEALNRHYLNGPPTDWHERYISSYATSHPSEDWAECWAHFLHFSALLETAESEKILLKRVGDDWYASALDLVTRLNEVTRSLGLPDAYPFVLSPVVVNKIDFISRCVREVSAVPRGVNHA